MILLRAVDKPLLYITLTLILSGLLILTSASMALSQSQFGTASYYALRQLLYGVLTGAALFLVSLHVPYRWWKKLALPLILLSFLTLALLFIPQLSFSFGGATRWLALGSLSFQPSEMLKLAFVIYLASWLDGRRREVASVSYGMIPFAIMLSIVGLFLIMQPDIGTLGVIAASALLLYFLGGGRGYQIAALIIAGLILLFILVQLAPYRMDRIRVFLDPKADPQGAGYQINQAFIAIGSGGFFGGGFGKSVQKYQYLPEPMGDSVFAIYAEELGFIGAAGLIGLFGAFLWRGLYVARNARDTFGKLLAAGIVISVVVQAFINMAAISGLLPLTGIPLPFISYGGTSLAITLASIGILMNISKHT